MAKYYALCERCLSRQMAQKGKRGGKSKECYICDGLMDGLDDLLNLILGALKGYQFRTFLIGAVLPSQMLEREDEVRARFKVRGMESVKSELTRELGKFLAGTTGARVDYRRPDVMINVDITNRQVAVRARAIYLFGRYVKTVRGLGQKQERCKECGGKGCVQCTNTGLSGFDSVEGIMVKKLIDLFRCDGAKFAWVGGEDKDSLVLNEGRPFFVKVINPKVRSVKFGRLSGNDVKMKLIREIDRLPDKPLKFRVKARLDIECECEVDSSMVDKVKALEGVTVKFEGKKSKEVSKKIHEISAKALEKAMEVQIVADGGLTLKQFVSGDGVEPSISQAIGCKASCRSFDVLDVQFAD
jgi:tRNA pseudouridine synthase 10